MSSAISTDLQRALTLLDLRRFEEAERFARMHLASAPDSAVALRVLACALLEQDRPGEALGPARDAVALEPQKPWGFIVLSEIYLALADQPSALAAASQAIAVAPHLWQAHATRAQARLSWPDRDPRGALADVEQARRLSPHESQIYNLYGCCLDELGQHGQARKAYQEALRLNPTDAMALNNLGAQELNKGRIVSASHYLTAGLAVAPQTHTLQANVDAVLVRFMQRLLWPIVGLGVAEIVLLATGQPWVVRALLGLAGLVTTAVLAGRVMRRLPHGTPILLRGLWGRSGPEARLVLTYWSIAALCVLLLTFAPLPVAAFAGLVLILLAKWLLLVLFGSWVMALINRVRRRRDRHAVTVDAF